MSQHNYTILIPCYNDDPLKQAYISKGEALFYSRNYSRSVYYYKKATAGRYEEPILLNICKAYVKANNKRGAVRTLQQMVRNGFSAFWMLDADRDFSDICRCKRVQTLHRKMRKKRWFQMRRLAVQYPEIAIEVLRMAHTDKLYLYMRRLTCNSLTASDQEQLEKSIFVRNYQYAKETFNKYGFLGYKEIGKEAAAAFWLLVQHSDADVAFQKRYLANLQQAMEVGNASPTTFAYLSDRVSKGEGRKQTFGTQLDYICKSDENYGYEHMTASLWPVEDEYNLDSLRKNVGLPSIAEYLLLVRQVQHF